MLHKLEKVTLVTEQKPPCIHMLLSQTFGIEYFVDKIVVICIKGACAKKLF
jgi:hypothetical protein